MKKLLIILATFVLMTSACNKTTGETEIVETALIPEMTDAPTAEPAPDELSVLIPFGSPALSMAGLLINEDNQVGEYSLDEYVTYKTEIVNGSDPLVAAFTSQRHDVIIAPTNLGAKF